MNADGRPVVLRVSQTLHASCIVVGEGAVLVRGPSGAGKSSLASLLLSQARARGEFAAWVADDRVIVRRFGRRLVASAHPTIAGRFEARGLGVLSAEHEPRAVLRFLVDLEPQVERLPDAPELMAQVAGVALPRLPLVAGRAGLYESDLVLNLLRMHQEDERHPTSIDRVGAGGI